MPYISQERRIQLDGYNPPLQSDRAETPGELNYKITVLLKDFLDLHGTNYTNMNNIVGAVECAKQEFIRRIINPYENTKIEENGDCY